MNFGVEDGFGLSSKEDARIKGPQQHSGAAQEVLNKHLLNEGSVALAHHPSRCSQAVPYNAGGKSYLNGTLQLLTSVFQTGGWTTEHQLLPSLEAAGKSLYWGPIGY